MSANMGGQVIFQTLFVEVYDCSAHQQLLPYVFVRFNATSLISCDNFAVFHLTILLQLKYESFF
jgi:hypothetical protein